ncbi:hypothetical protein DFR86_01190 [Acidianus sulfidivorans JP7]|uniref:Uncharacterized protein n=1 Tax=Acidianus sulfidivorans JP7 TaxID=619593 RepID=A0A2U9IJS2_9CREN|nr:hypothetical protein [Acidianus sulfidivorans]AWR96291.1 hypothetical protein DFR86_01190 [Acidianus sulfidivorans JP7]
MVRELQNNLEELFYSANLGNTNARNELKSYMLNKLSILNNKNREKINKKCINRLIEEISTVFTEYGYKCPYCGSKLDTVIDFCLHLSLCKDEKHKRLLHEILSC